MCKQNNASLFVGEKQRLKKEAVPSVFPFVATCTPQESPRMDRKRRRDLHDTSSPSTETYTDIQSEVEISSTSTSDLPGSSRSEDVVHQEPLSSVCESVQCDLKSVRFSIFNFETNPKLVTYYTGFNDFDHFMVFFHCLGPCVYELRYKCTSIPPIDQLFLTLMKLRQAKEDIELSLFFNISESTVSRIVINWINFLYFQLKELNIWPSVNVIKESMPSDFKKKFPNTRVILDATEVPIEKPSDVNAQSITWSSYKHKNTLKTMIGCTPRGAVSYISNSFGGSASDRQIIENSPLLDPNFEMFQKGDSIMADRGIMVQDLFAAQDVYVNTPTMLKGKSQLDAHEVIHDRRVASKRIHIERIIGLSKRFKILTHALPESKLKLSSRIVYVCFLISNFRNSIVDEHA